VFATVSIFAYLQLLPKCTAQFVINYLVPDNMESQIEKLSLFEVILEENMERPLHPSENVTEIYRRWSSWEDVDCLKNNYLIVKANTLYPALQKHVSQQSTTLMHICSTQWKYA